MRDFIEFRDHHERAFYRWSEELLKNKNLEFYSQQILKKNERKGVIKDSQGMKIIKATTTISRLTTLRKYLPSFLEANLEMPFVSKYYSEKDAG